MHSGLGSHGSQRGDVINFDINCLGNEENKIPSCAYGKMLHLEILPHKYCSACQILLMLLRIYVGK